MSKVSRLRVVANDGVAELPDLPDEVRIALSEAAGWARERLLAMSVATGLQVMAAMMEAEVTRLTSPRGKHDPDRTVGRHGTARTSVTLGARRVPVDRPRARSTDGQEVTSSTFAAFTDDDPLDEAVMSRMLAGLAAHDMLHTVLRRRENGESVEDIRTDLIIPTGKREGHNPSTASITGPWPTTPSASATPTASTRPTPTSPPCRSVRERR